MPLKRARLGPDQNGPLGQLNNSEMSTQNYQLGQSTMNGLNNMSQILL